MQPRMVRVWRTWDRPRMPPQRPSEAESRPIIDYLLGVATRPEFTCRLRWEQGTLTMWDNPHVLHTAINDYSGYRRVTYRTTVEGRVPQAASAAPLSRAA